MAQLTWDNLGERTFETGVDHGVLYLPNAQGVYDTAKAWNGLTAITQSPSGAEASAQWADNIKYLNLVSAEEFGATVEAFTYPDEFAQCDGTAIVGAAAIGQQARKLFGLSYRSRKGNDLVGTDFGYKIHLIYGALAAPSEKAHSTMNDSPEALTFSWELTTTPVSVSNLRPTSIVTVDSTKTTPALMLQLENVLYGTGGTDGRLPLPDEVISIIGSTATVVNLATPANQPTYNSTTHVVTLPAVTGVQWKVNGVNKAAGAQPALAVGTTATVVATATAGYSLKGDDDWTYDY